MQDKECVEFLQWCLPRMRLRWQGFRKVRRQVSRRLAHRLRELGLPDLAAYKAYLEDNEKEWPILDSFCQITISRFYRDRIVFDALGSSLLPEKARRAIEIGEGELRCWSIGCCSGEEPYTMQILWQLCVLPHLTSHLPFRITATATDESLIARAKEGRYPESSLRDFPPHLIPTAFTSSEEGYRIHDRFKENIDFRVQDIRQEMPERVFHLILCRNLVFTYFDLGYQQEILPAMLDRLAPGGLLVLGMHETLPGGHSGLEPVPSGPCIYRKKG